MSSGSWFMRAGLALLAFHMSLCRSAPTRPSCNCMPNEACWPTVDEWHRFNASIGGKLIKTIPLATPCHEPGYDASACQYLKNEWNQPELHDLSSSSIMAAAVYNASCDPFSPLSSSCTLGNMVSYTINATTSSDFSEGIKFAKQRNIRLVVRNTGHDYLGKSTGAGGLSIWTHHLKAVDFLNYTSPHYEGPAVKMGAGIQGIDVYTAAHDHGYVIVGGECATVGPVGGYTQGGGHSALSSKFGLAADQTLEWEVIDGNGQFLKASPTENPDLYWALSGGGAGTYGVVYSLTVKAYPDFPVTGVVLDFGPQNSTADLYYEAIGRYHRMLPTWTAAGGMAIGEITNESFLLTPLTLPNVTRSEATALIQPFLDDLDEMGITYHVNLTSFPGYLQHYQTLIEPNPTQLVNNAQYGGRFIPLSTVEADNDKLTSAIRKMTEEGVAYVGIGLNVSSSIAADPYNAVHPSWRTAVMSAILTASWPNGASLSAMKIIGDKMTNEWVPSLAALAPDSGCYMNEADPHQPDWKEAFYSSNYDTLYNIKQKYDPQHIFYAPTAVGSDDWQVMDDGKLCRINGK